MSDPLLAKSWKGSIASAPPAITLVGHTACVMKAVAALFGSEEVPTRLGRSWLRFFGLAEAEFSRFIRHLLVAAALHDWGKANRAFQDAVTDQGEQVIRHEHLSGLLLTDLIADRAVLAWLNAAGIDEVILLAAVISHHVKVGVRGPHTLGSYMGNRDTFRLLCDHNDFLTVWRMVENAVGSPCPVRPSFPGLWKKETIQERSVKAIKLLNGYTSLLADDHDRNLGSLRPARH